MNVFLKKAGLGIALATTALAGAMPAQAQHYGGYRGGRGGDAAGAAILGGILGLGVGAAIASNHDRRYYAEDDRGYYDAPPPPRAYYRGGYESYDGYAPRCWRQWRWDPYYGRNVSVRVCN